jgi:hypothetical protein
MNENEWKKPEYTSTDKRDALWEKVMDRFFDGFPEESDPQRKPGYTGKVPWSEIPNQSTEEFPLLRSTSKTGYSY